MIESVNNEKIKNYAKLQNKKYRDLESLFIVEGEHLLEEAKKRGLLVEAFSLDGREGTAVSSSVMRKLSSLNSIPNVLGIARKCERKEISGNLLILDGIQDPGNLGTIIRSAVAFNIDTIVASYDTVDVYNSKTIRSSEGMIFNINYIVDDIAETVKSLNNYNIYVTNVLSGKPLENIDKHVNYALVMGSEGSGVRDEIKSLATDTLYIPMNKACESLNVAIATSIILYELNKG